MFFTFFVSVNFLMGQQANDEKEGFIIKFMDSMSNDTNLNNYVLYSEGKEINVLLVEKYKIIAKENNLFTVDIDHGKGSFCTRIYIEIDNDTLKIKGVQDVYNPNVLNPWKEKIRICKK